MLQDLWIVHFEKRFTTTYVVALGVLAGFAIFSQFFGFYQFIQRDTTAHILNVAGRQRALAQALTTMALRSRDCRTPDDWRAWASEMSESLAEWERVQDGLRTRDARLGLSGQNTQEVEANLSRVSVPFEQMKAAAHGMVTAAGEEAQKATALEPLIQKILSNSRQYFTLMDETTAMYELETTTRGTRVQVIQMMFPAGMLFLLFLLGIFIFRPAGERMNRTVEALRDSERRFHTFMDNSPLVAFMKDEQGRYVYVNQAFRRLFRASNSDLIGKTDEDLQPQEIAKKLRDNDLGVLADNRSAEILETMPGEKGDVRQWLAVKFPFVSQSGERFLGGACIDMTDRMTSEEALRASEKRWQLALRGTNDGLWDWNAITNEVFYSARWKQMLGYGDNEIPNVTEEWEHRVHPDDLLRVKTELDAHLQRKTPYYVSEYRMRCRDGNYRWVLARGQAVWDENGKALRMAGSHTDITDRKKAEEQLTHEAAYDPLTQLSNRRRLLEQVAHSYHAAKSKGQSLCICLCDIDKFKQVNDDCGHAVGDRVLSTFAQILREALRSTDIAGRLGGDEFCVILPGARAHEAENTMERVRSRLETILFAQRDGRPFHVSATFGVTEMSATHSSDAELMDAADQALYEGKRNGRNRVHIVRRDDKPKAARYSS
jgi:diguanylate cyclase (GGDEF)-like protein/PAS domain S-box-containing protein